MSVERMRIAWTECMDILGAMVGAITPELEYCASKEGVRGWTQGERVTTVFRAGGMFVKQVLQNTGIDRTHFEVEAHLPRILGSARLRFPCPWP
jgi:hypothetical protein